MTQYIKLQPPRMAGISDIDADLMQHDYVMAVGEDGELFVIRKDNGTYLSETILQRMGKHGRRTGADLTRERLAQKP